MAKPEKPYSLDELREEVFKYEHFRSLFKEKERSLSVEKAKLVSLQKEVDEAEEKMKSLEASVKHIAGNLF